MLSRWTHDQVAALAPDASSLAAGRKLANPALWSAAGRSDDPAAVWGECRGSGSSPYRTMADLAGPAFSCSCPSRKFPCKHAVGLLLLWVAGGLAEGPPGEAVTAWLAAREERAARSRSRAQSQAGVAAGHGAAPEGSGPEGSGPEGSGPVGAQDAARARAERRQQRMLDGLAEFDRWLCDQVRAGLAGPDRAGYELFDTVAARLVDAQVPAVAARVRSLAATAVSGEGWPARLLEEYALLHLLAVAAPAALADAGSGLAATVRAHLGVPVAKEDVLACPAVRDRWAVLALRDEAEDRLTVRRVWLRGEGCQRLALVMSFAPPGQPLDASLVPGTTVDADLHFYPGAVPLRALTGTRHATLPMAAVPSGGLSLAAAVREWAAALTADPWLRSWPVVLGRVVPVADDAGWWLTDAGGALPLAGPVDWALPAVSGGHPLSVLAEIVPAGVRTVRVLGPARVPAPDDVREPDDVRQPREVAVS